MKKHVIAAAAILVMFAAAFAVGVTRSDAAAGCAQAWTETVHHEAVTYVVHHEAVTHVVHHEAITHVVHHEAVTHEETEPGQRYKWNPRGPQDEAGGPGPGSTPLTDPDHWQANTSHHDGSDPLGEVFLEGNGNGNDNGSWFYWTVVTTTVVDSEAYDEEVVDGEAYDEEIVDGEAYDEEVVDSEAYDEEVRHPAVACPDPEPTLDPEPDPEPTPTDPKPAVPTSIDAGL